jgi:hypothetical protein
MISNDQEAGHRAIEHELNSFLRRLLELRANANVANITDAYYEFMENAAIRPFRELAELPKEELLRDQDTVIDRFEKRINATHEQFVKRLRIMGLAEKARADLIEAATASLLRMVKIFATAFELRRQELAEELDGHGRSETAP